ncbi:MAG: tRNA (adenosine(37)-N6)-threonylcarbamoyltransferase complex ATPase subunit type 1 TsaE [SAR324 cluster bacterium]|nr:tRNA (adenosine(37)-N6)-threonylcarbamoyltransferase complex ATPase subunit type 1 TsaE [SAR324 cluster bacterium]
MKISELLSKINNLPESLSGINIALVGTLGAGKTHFVQELAAGSLGFLKDEITSPSFSLINHYSNSKIELFHVDLYRIEEAEELLEIGIYEILENEKSLVFIEWADLFDEILEMCQYIVYISILDSGMRDYKFVKND